MAETNLIYQRALRGDGREVTEEEFIRNAYIELYSADDTEENIDEIQLSSVEVEDDHFLLVDCYYDATVTAEVGYNVQEQYVDKENVVIDGKTYTKDVIKTRTVTRWQPFSLNVNDVNYLEIENMRDAWERSSTLCRYKSTMEYLTKETCTVGQSLPFGPIPVNHVDIDESEQAAFPHVTEMDIIDKANGYAKVGYPFVECETTMIPGDTHRNFKPMWTLKKVTAIASAVKKFKASFTYRGDETCEVSQRVTQNYVSTTYPRDTEDEELNAAKTNKEESLKGDSKIVELREKAGKNFKIMAIGMGGSLLLSFIIASLGAICVASLIGFLIWGLVSSKKIEKAIAEREKEIKEQYDSMIANRTMQIQDKKIELLNARFAKMGFAPLTEDEIARFAVE